MFENFNKIGIASAAMDFQILLLNIIVIHYYIYIYIYMNEIKYLFPPLLMLR